MIFCGYFCIFMSKRWGFSGAVKGFGEFWTFRIDLAFWGTVTFLFSFVLFFVCFKSSIKFWKIKHKSAFCFEISPSFNETLRHINLDPKSSWFSVAADFSADSQYVRNKKYIYIGTNKSDPKIWIRTTNFNISRNITNSTLFLFFLTFLLIYINEKFSFKWTGEMVQRICSKFTLNL